MIVSICQECFALWMLLKTSMGKSSMNVQLAWDGLNSMDVGANKIKNDTLMSFVVLPEGAWEEKS